MENARRENRELENKSANPPKLELSIIGTPRRTDRPYGRSVRTVGTDRPYGQSVRNVRTDRLYGANSDGADQTVFQLETIPIWVG